MSDAEILFERRGRLGLVTLNRPKAMNALTQPMLLALERQLDAWRGDAANAKEAQAAFYHRAKLNGAARHGAYTPEMEAA